MILRRLLEAQHAAAEAARPDRTVEVFFSAGRREARRSEAAEADRAFNKAWKAACKAVGLPNLIFHDLRRTGARNLIRAGVSENVAMRITGHKTNSVFKRSNDRPLSAKSFVNMTVQ